MPSTEIQSWKKPVEDKWVLFDTDAVISLLGFEQVQFLEELSGLAAELTFIHPVLLELMNTGKSSAKLMRSQLLTDYDFTELPLTNREIKLSSQIQESLPLNCQPSPTDLYLAGTLSRYHENMLLLTANIKDFPLPIFNRKGHVLLQNEKNLKVLTLLSINKSMLVEG